MPVDIVPYIGLPTFADYLTPSHTNGFDDSYTFWDEIHIGDLLHAEGQPANR